MKKIKKLIFVTGNKEKIAIANTVLQNTKFEIETQKIYCEEIQSDDIEEIASKSAQYASNILKKTVIKVDSGLFIKALNEFPGPYSAFVEKKINAELILKMMKGEKNRTAYYKEALAYCKPGENPIIFSTFTYGNIALRAKGKYGWNFDRIFITNGDNQTMANFPDKERIAKYSNKNWKKLLKLLTD
jgi:XTP/dITP diphosphohydrolase